MSAAQQHPEFAVDAVAIEVRRVRDEVVARVDHLKLPSYTGFVMPKLEAVKDKKGKITDVKISYPCDLTAQMLEYSEL